MTGAMRACFLTAPGQIEIREVPVPAPSDGELLLQVKAALTCGTDLKAFHRGHPMIPMPGLFGHEFSGVVAAAGRGIRRFREGDEVMAVHSAPCGACAFCSRKLFNLCDNIMRTKVLGAYAEFILLPRHIVRQNVHPKPSHLGFEEAAMLEPLACVVHGMKGLAVSAGTKVVIIGTGPIGLLHLILAKSGGAAVVIAGRENERLRIARKLGADRAVMPGNLARAVGDATEGIGADLVFECTGQVGVWEESVDYLRRGGAVVLFGGCREGTRAGYDTYRLHYDELTLRGVFHFTPADVRAAYRLLDGGLDVSPLISGRLPLSKLSVALERLSRGEGVKYAIIP